MPAPPKESWLPAAPPPARLAVWRRKRTLEWRRGPGARRLGHSEAQIVLTPSGDRAVWWLYWYPTGHVYGPFGGERRMLEKSRERIYSYLHAVPAAHDPPEPPGGGWAGCVWPPPG